MGLFGDHSKSDRYRELLDALEAGEAPPPGATMEDVAFVERFLGVSRNAIMREPSDSVRAALIAHFDAWARERRPSLLDRITAVLVFDSATAGPMLAGARGATDTARQRIYAWEGGEVVVRMRSVSGELQLDGQLLPDTDDPSLYTMALVVDGEQVGAATPVDGVGEFAVAGQPGRVASLVARGEAFEIEFGPFEVSD